MLLVSADGQNKARRVSDNLDAIHAKPFAPTEFYGPSDWSYQSHAPPYRPEQSKARQ